MAGTKRKYSGDHLDQYVCSANDVIDFKIVLNKQDIDDAESFKPEYTHQFFGDSENIFGYTGLEVNMMYSACRLTPYFGIKYREKVKVSKTGGIEPDNVLKIISDKLELELGTDLEAFKDSLNKESSFKPFGDLLDTFSIDNEGKKETYGVYRADSATLGFREYHQKMQTLVMWFIDAASFIDDEDERWDYFILHQHLEDNGKTIYPFVGYATVYRYYAYPLQVRPRISQMLVLPLFQNRGLGSRLLESIYDCYVKDQDVLDITVEDPSEEFIRIRDFIDCKKCLSLPCFAKDSLQKGFKPEMAEEAKKMFKINKKQARRVYEILRLKYTDVKDKDQYRLYRLDVKNRLNIPFQREKLDFEKLQKNLSLDELKAAVNPMPRDQRMEQLDHSFQELEEKYKHIIERLGRDL